MNINKIFLLLILLFNSSYSLTAEKLEFFDSNFSDYVESLVEAKEDGKDGIFIFFHLEDCPFCHKMYKTVLNKKPVIDYFRKHFLNFLEDTESDIELVDFKGRTVKGKFFAQKYNRIGATPVLAFFDLNGNKIVTRTGFANEKEFLLLAQYVVEKAYLIEKFIRYKRRHNKG